jgi:hypothetical protein
LNIRPGLGLAAAARVRQIEVAFAGPSHTFVGFEATAPQAVCDILDLTLGPLHLDVLGLVVDLNQVHLQITAESGQGNLLGNLLCSVAGLLDNPGGLDLGGLLQQIVNLLNQILGQL